MKTLPATFENPLAAVMSDDLFRFLYINGYLVDTAIRNNQIRKRYRQLRSQKTNAIDAINIILEEYNKLKYDTIRKIVYSKLKYPPES